MGKTITEKILARASGKASVSPGEHLSVTSRCPYTMESVLGRRRGPDHVKEVGLNKVYDAQKVMIVMGHPGTTSWEGVSEKHLAIKKWAKEVGIPQQNVYDLGRAGIEHVFIGEKGWALPGEVLFESGNGHTTTLGALGCFAVTTSYGSGGFLATGRTWIQVPKSAKFNITGKLPKGVTARDVFEYVFRQVGPSGATGQVMEWTGSTIDAMTMDERFTLTSQALFTGALTGIIAPDKTALDWVKARAVQDFDPVYSDPDAEYAAVHNFDVSNLVPQVAVPPKRHSLTDVTEVLGKKIQKGFIGSCANGRLEDMRLVAKILKGKKIHPEVMLNITPATPEVLKACVKEGLMEIFINAEAAIPSPACGQCYGANTPLAGDEVCISSSTCNYPGRMGSTKAEIFLASPATVAASCLEGMIADPRKYL